MNVRLRAAAALSVFSALGLIHSLGTSEASAATLNVPVPYPSIANAVAAAAAGDQIVVAGSHTESLASVININLANLQILGSPGATVNVTASSIAMAVYAPGVVIDGLTFTSPTPWVAAFLQVTANNVTISNTTIYGPPQALPMSGWVVNRALAVSPGVTGVQILNNTWHTLRSGAYMDNASGTVSGNLVYNTKGGFIGAGNVTYTGNSWGPLATANEWDIVLFDWTTPGLYPDLLALSNANNGGSCWDQRIASASRKVPVYVDAAAGPGGIGSPRLPYTTIQAGIDDVYPGGTVEIANGTYVEAPNVYKPCTLDGASRAGVLIDASSFADYGIDAMGDYAFRFQHFTLKGHPTNTASYGLKVAGDNATVVIDDLEVWNSRRSCIDLNGCNAPSSINNVYAHGAAYGVGVGLTNCNGTVLSNITTAGNPWGGIAVYTSSGPYTPGSNGVTLVPGGNSFGEPVAIYSESNGIHPITNLSVSPAEFGYLVGSSAAPNYRFYYASEGAGLAAILAGGPTAGWLQNRNTSVYVVDPATGMKFAPALGVAAANATIDFRAGVVEEQVVITTPGLTIDGAGVASSTIQAPVSCPALFNSAGPTPNHPVVFVNGAQDVILKELTVNGLGRAAGNYRFIGVAFWNGDGKLLDARVTGIRENPFNGSQHGMGVYVNNDVAGTYNVEVGNTTIDDFQKNGTVFAGTGTTVDMHDCVVTGQGPTALIAQNCIQYSFGGGGSIERCSVSGSVYTPASVTSTGVIAYANGPLSIADMNGAHGIDDCQTGIYVQDGNATINGVDLTYSLAAPAHDGVDFYNTSSSLTHPEDSGALFAGRPQVEPVDAAALSLGGSSPLLLSMSGSLANACLIGNDLSVSDGLWVGSAGGPVSVTATNNKIRDWNRGVVAYGAAVSLTANDNEIASNLTAGYDNTASGAAQDAEQNWWGDAAGPAGAGDDVLGANVDYTPWRTSNASSTPCAFTPTFSNEVGPVGPGNCISVLSGCVAVPFNITRTDVALLRGFSVTFTLGGGLSLCGPGIVTGSYLIGGAQYQVLNNGGGSYTVDGATLGMPCGTTTPTGTLFTVNVTGSGVGTGTVTMTDLILRDCDNVPIPGTMGAPINITIDTVPPVAVANLVATQIKTGNDADGTTKIGLAFTAPGDAATVEVYRKGYGNYPEYDDCAGSGVPAIPSYPPTGAGWALTSVTASGQDDETTARDFWYYVVFTKDACGNVSAVSNMTAGKLNYHLGDVSNGFVTGTGDNLVATADISALGAHYGETLSPTCGDTENYLDVGPTTDFSVNARPSTDNKINFEDLIMFAINHGTVSFAPPEGNGDVTASEETPSLRLAIDPRANPNAPLVARLFLEGNLATAKGIHALIGFDRAKLELVSMTEGALLAEQIAPVFAKTLDEEKGAWFDAALLGDGLAFRGSGEIAIFSFRPKTLGAQPTLLVTDLRDVQNQKLDGSSQPIAADATTPAPSAVTPFALLGARPNPFQGSTEILFRLPEAARVELRIYDAAGRLVRSLLDGSLSGGEHAIGWDGRNDAGERLGPGVYFYGLATGERSEARKLLLLK
ncbi:MAG: T9SS type A sorting domain-containing protein [Candidatus Eisenbacteria bacterium]|nr:T9SS type A sorting domain-containing protein [Candidatus Eisenbacteria bacterium]